jgi:hypothetical protein
MFVQPFMVLTSRGPYALVVSYSIEGTAAPCLPYALVLSYSQEGTASENAPIYLWGD